MSDIETLRLEAHSNDLDISYLILYEHKSRSKF